MLAVEPIPVVEVERVSYQRHNPLLAVVLHGFVAPEGKGRCLAMNKISLSVTIGPWNHGCSAAHWVITIQS